MAYYNLTAAAESNLCEDQPFECMYIKEVNCGKCGNPLGMTFLTANIDGTAWLLNRTALNA